MRCTLCPDLTPNKSNWCEECKIQEDFNKFMDKMEGYKKALKPLMRDNPNWEDHAHPYDGC